jgi:uncharacterized membrane protein YadS
MLPLDWKFFDAAEDTGSVSGVEKTSSFFFLCGIIRLGCSCNWAAFGRAGLKCLVLLWPAWYVLVWLSALMYDIVKFSKWSDVYGNGVAPI